MAYITSELIRKKRFGEKLSHEEIEWFVKNYVTGVVSDSQMAAFAMAVCLQGMAPDETASLTRVMRDSGEVLDFSDEKVKIPAVDKHSTGGIGDKTSLIVGPILAALGIRVPMLAGRGLGHTGGTIDKLEAIEGFSADHPLHKFSNWVREFKFALMAQTSDICPADRKLYALRDITGTVDSLPLICANIMGKKLAENLTGLVLDVKYGSGAFMKTVQDAEALASLLVDTGKAANVKTVALITDMSQPLGRFIGNAPEVIEAIDILLGRSGPAGAESQYKATRDLSLALAAHGMMVAGVAPNLTAAKSQCEKMLTTGAAYVEFEKMVVRQGAKYPLLVKKAAQEHTVVAKSNGFVTAMNVEKLGWAMVKLGVGRQKPGDAIDHSAGAEVLGKLGDKIKIGQPLLRMMAAKSDFFTIAEKDVLAAITISETNTYKSRPLIEKVIE